MYRLHTVCDILNSLVPIVIPVIFLFIRIWIARISAQSKNKYGDIGSSCRHPLSLLNHSDICPFT